MIDYTEFESKKEDFVYKELTPIQRAYVDKLYKRERGQQDTMDSKYRSVIFGKYHFIVGDDPFALQRDWPPEEKIPIRDIKK